MILIFSIENDTSTSSVVKWLKHFGEEVVVINSDDDTSKFIQLNNDGIFFKNMISGKEFNLLDVKSCWWRRSGIGLKNFLKSKAKKDLLIDNIDISEIIIGSRSLIRSETESLREYIFNRIYENCRINIGSPKLYGLNRLVTMDLARKKGFKVPEFEIISNLKQISLSKYIGDYFVSKAISDGIYHQIDGKMFYSYTELHQKMYYKNQDLNVFPSLITNVIDKKMEIRSFYLDGHFFSMAIFSQSNDQTKVDFRKYSSKKPNKTEPYRLPLEVEKKLKAIFDEYGLNCGSADLILDKNNDFVFLEINPVGQYGMTSEPGNYNLDKIIAQYLIHGKLYNTESAK
ncbi:MAG: grasp-with-spasm system ATP-grasp peptide maturase [Bergeyella sp.]